MVRGRYTTKQQIAIETFMQEHEGFSYTVDMLCSELIQKGISIGKTTVYRCLERLVQDQKIIAIPDVSLGCIRYCYANTDPTAMYLMCDDCHRVKPLNCKAINSFISHVADEHEFQPDNQKTIMYGKCRECGKHEKLS